MATCVLCHMPRLEHSFYSAQRVDRTMPHYRIYLLSALDRVEDAVDSICESDGDARRHARTVIGDYPAVEIWTGTRRVGKFMADQLTDPG